MVRGICLIIVAVLCTCCDTVDFKGFITHTSDAVDKRFEKSMLLNGNKTIATIAAEESYSLYVCTDPHIDGSYNNLREFSTRMRNNSSAAFGVVLGDCDNHRNALPTYIEALEYVEGVQANNKPIFSLLGNHDIYFNGWDEYSKLLGPSVYWFSVQYDRGHDLFIVLDTASGTLGGKQMSWLREFITSERDNYRHCIVLTHTNLFYTDNSQLGSGNLTIEETAYLTNLFSLNRVTLCLQGHDHYREDLMLNGVRYTVVGTIQDNAPRPEYLVIHISNNTPEYQWEYIE